MADDELRSDTGPFTIVPEWVCDSGVSDRAIRLYVVLGHYADAEGRCWPKRTTLAKRMQCSPDSVDRARDALAAVGALASRPRHNNDGSQSSNLYVLRRARPPSAPVPTPLCTSADPPSAPTRTRTRPNKPDPLNARANTLAREFWERYQHANARDPMQPFPAITKVITGALKAKWTDAQVRKALARCTIPISRATLGKALERVGTSGAPDFDHQSRRRGIG